MSVELAIILGFLFHILGDYFLQPEYMMNNKSKNTFLCSLHVVIYSIPFLFITDMIWWLTLVVLTHFFIDRFGLAVGVIMLKNWNFDKKDSMGMDDRTPDGLKWLKYVIIDNGLHLSFNTLAIWLSFN